MNQEALELCYEYLRITQVLRTCSASIHGIMFLDRKRIETHKAICAELGLRHEDTASVTDDCLHDTGDDLYQKFIRAKKFLAKKEKK